MTEFSGYACECSCVWEHLGILQITDTRKPALKSIKSAGEYFSLSGTEPWRTWTTTSTSHTNTDHYTLTHARVKPQDKHIDLPDMQQRSAYQSYSYSLPFFFLYPLPAEVWHSVLQGFCNFPKENSSLLGELQQYHWQDDPFPSIKASTVACPSF